MSAGANQAPNISQVADGLVEGRRGYHQRTVAVLLDQTLEVGALDLGDEGVLHRLGHLLAGATLDETHLADELARTAIGQGQLLAVTGHLGDLHAARS